MCIRLWPSPYIVLSWRAAITKAYSILVRHRIITPSLNWTRQCSILSSKCQVPDKCSVKVCSCFTTTVFIYIIIMKSNKRPNSLISWQRNPKQNKHITHLRSTVILRTVKTTDNHATLHPYRWRVNRLWAPECSKVNHTNAIQEAMSTIFLSGRCSVWLYTML